MSGKRFVVIAFAALVTGGASGLAAAQSTKPPMQGESSHGAMKHGGGHMHDAVPADLDLATTRASEAGRYRATLLPQGEAPALNRMHGYVLSVTTATGAPVDGARIAIDGGMPQHGHGLPTAPQVTRALGDGRYLVEGVQYSMAGWWELSFAIDAAAGTDRVVFNLVSK